ncbi:hypothetical protein Sjap_007284 [Stephania japonica]|uniref:Trichome birefringence-like C-terminal domain-containing protein n=1 Tax=Stephania japonica TaxID=461633 RepID=A0AAP0PDK2_9MAGN
MERQRSFSFKPTRLLLFSFTISSSLLFFTFFSIWAFKAAPSIPRETHVIDVVILNTSSLNLGLKPMKAHALIGFLTNLTHEGTSEAKDSILGDGHAKNGVLETTHYAKSGGNVSRDRDVNGSSENASVVVGRSVERNTSGDQNGGLGSARYAKSGILYEKGDGALDAIKDPKRVYETHGRRITKEKGNYSFKFVDYKCTVEFYVTHFLVHESKGRVKQRRVPTLRLDALDKGSSRWRGADILVFNTAHWWSHFKTKSGVNYYQEGNQVHPHLDVSTAFRKALITWASWVDKHINPTKTQVFFRSSAPSHFRGGQWNSGGHCKEGVQPLNDSSHVSYPERNLIVEEVLKHMRTPVTLLNITSLSEYRIDGHPSIYGKRPGRMPSSTVQDCSHWCLPGVPDTWNELLYFYLQSRQNGSYTI